MFLCQIELLLMLFVFKCIGVLLFACPTVCSVVFDVVCIDGKLSNIDIFTWTSSIMCTINMYVLRFT